ncbi:MAG: hypothetical protein EOL97_08620 [Spirochaetia bacterium]|nr:hypothetical protein [Spirochaetia bacterium]
MMSEIYRKPFQKSYTFLYPALGLRKNGIKPEQTFLSANNIQDNCLICIYKITNDETWRKFEYGTLREHPLLLHILDFPNNKKAFIFNLEDFKEDINLLKNSKYSKISSRLKKYIIDYYGVTSPMFVYIESFLFPEKYIKRYSELLAIDEEVLMEVGELCEKIDLLKEECPYAITEEMIAYSNYITV